MDHARSAADRKQAARIDRGALCRWLALHGALGLLAALLVYASGRVLAGDGADIGAPELRSELAAARPDVLLLGNSMLGDGVNADLLDELLRGEASAGATGGAGPHTFKHAVAGLNSAYWYLYLKNCAVATDSLRLVVIPFRDPVLTFATLRVNGSYAPMLERASRPDEPELARVIALNTRGAGNLGDRAFAALRREVPAYAARDRLGDDLFDVLKALPAGATLGLLPAYAQAVPAVLPARAFVAEEEGVRAPGTFDAGPPGAGDAPPRAPGNEETPFGTLEGTPASAVFEAFDYVHFDRVVDASLLPPIVDLCRVRGWQLALLRLHRWPLPDWSDLAPPELLAAYQDDIDRWLAARGVILLDTTQDAAFTESAFRGPDHLSEVGREHLTIKLAQWLAEWWDQERAHVHPAASAAPPRSRAELEEAWLDVDRRLALERAFLRLQQQDDRASVTERLVEWVVPAATVEMVQPRLFRVALPADIAEDGDTQTDPERSRWALLEDGRPLGPAHRLPPAIAKLGGGRYSHSGGELFFSTPDDSSPRDNGRHYALRKRLLTLAPRS